MTNNTIIIYDAIRHNKGKVLEKLICPYIRDALSVPNWSSAWEEINSVSPMYAFKVKVSPRDIKKYAKSKKIGLERITTGVSFLKSLNTTRKELYQQSE